MNKKLAGRYIQHKITLIICLTFITLVMNSCLGDAPKHYISYYYWKTSFQPDSIEQKYLDAIEVPQVYVRYFDLVLNETAQQVQPQMPLQWTDSKISKPIVPVIFIKNNIWEHLDSNAIDTLAQKSIQLLEQMNKAKGLKCQALQIDCDWTASTQNKYFYYLKSCRKILDAHEPKSSFAPLSMLSSTIRLHQLKYPEKTGVPPVDKGVLMLYNMGKIDATEQNSIYNRQTCLQYLPSISRYKLRLDVALPIFSWGIHLRGQQVLGLMPKLSEDSLNKITEFKKIRSNRYQVQKALFFEQHYFQENDEIKFEHVPMKDLLLLVDDLKKYYPNQIQQFIFFDLDQRNLINYEKDFAQKIIHSY